MKQYSTDNIIDDTFGKVKGYWLKQVNLNKYLNHIEDGVGGAKRLPLCLLKESLKTRKKLKELGIMYQNAVYICNF